MVKKAAKTHKAAAARPNVELVGATEAALKISGGETGATVKLDPPANRKVAASLARAASAAAIPDRVFLNLENVRATAGAPAFHVYVGLSATRAADI